MRTRSPIPGVALLLAALPLMGTAAVSAAPPVLNPVAWTIQIDAGAVRPGGTALARIAAQIEPGWHLYALAVPKPIIPTSIRIAPNPAIESIRIYQPAAHTAFDQNFGFEVGTYEGEAVFPVELHIAGNAAAGAVPLEARMRFQTCNGTMCLPPRAAIVSAALTVDPAAPPAEKKIPSGYTLFDPSAPMPVAQASADVGGFVLFLLAAFGLGFAAIFTPCVFPMIPITVSYFLKRPGQGRAEGLADAVLFSAGIIVLFTALGLLATAILGPFGVVKLGSNVWVNAFIALVFL
ncbi:MAG: protein-disulfide reductase DsbD domain-containing protein, partial [Bryobacteraceae bacterium]